MTPTHDATVEPGPESFRRQVALVVLLVLVAAALVLAQLPFDVAAIRLGPLSLLWWYAGVAAPAVATVVVLVVLADRTS